MKETTLDKIIAESNYAIIPGTFCYCKVSVIPPDIKKHFAVILDDSEITVVTNIENIDDLKIIKKHTNYFTLFALNVSQPFASIGFIAKISKAISGRNINVLIISTFSKDYLLVNNKFCKIAQDALSHIGLKRI